MARQYNLMSADGHLEVPPERWVHRVPEKYRDRAPHTVHLPDGGDALMIEGQPLPAYFGMSMMFPHIHPLARAAQNYYQEANACIGIIAYLDRVDDPLVRHEHLSQRDEELMHFMEGKFQIDFLCATEETQKPVEDALDYLLHQVGGIR